MLLNYIKDYFVLTLILLVFSYLSPGENYKKYFQFFIGIIMAVFVLKPVFGWMSDENTDFAYESIEEISDKLSGIEYGGEGEDIFEIFFVEDDTQED